MEYHLWPCNKDLEAEKTAIRFKKGGGGGTFTVSIIFESWVYNRGGRKSNRTLSQHQQIPRVCVCEDDGDFCLIRIGTNEDVGELV